MNNSTTDWQKHTCGECGYCLPLQGNPDGLCRRNTWLWDRSGQFEAGTLTQSYPACPDFVLREVPE